MLNKVLHKNPALEKHILKTFSLLEEDVFHPALKTHKLHGKLSQSYSCSVNREYRILFEFDISVIYLISIGTHDEVY